MTPYPNITFDTIINQFGSIIGVNGCDKRSSKRAIVTKILYDSRVQASLLIFIIISDMDLKKEIIK